MPVENAIELFNCSLCSFCETSLDGLAHHIRRHIKPEPCANIRDDANINSNNCLMNDETSSHLNDIESSQVISQNDVPLMAVTAETSNNSNALNRDGNLLSPRIEVMNPRTVFPNATNSHTRYTEKEIASFDSYNGNHPPVLEKVSPSHSGNPMSQPSVRYVNSVSSVTELDKPPGTRYVQLHPREPPYIEICCAYPFVNQHVTNVNNKTVTPRHDLISVVPGKTSIQEFQRVPPRDVIYKSIPDHPNSIQKGIVNTPFATSMNHVRVHTGNSDVQFHTTHSHDLSSQNILHRGYQGTPIMPKETNRDSPTIYHTPQHRMTPVGLPSLPLPHSSLKGTEASTKQYNSLMGNLHLPDIALQHSQSIVGVPNNGTVILNPSQLMVTGGNNSMEQLAGVLVVPLKKTSDVACQTNPVIIEGCDNVNKHSRSVQTDLYVEQCGDRQTSLSNTPLENFRVTDDLFECVVCGEEFASDHHLQEHIAKQHTYVCDKCYHSSTNISDHNLHISDCGNGEMEMICIECNTSFSSLRKMNQHRSKAHNVRMPFRCGVCNVPFETHEAVMEHINTHDTHALEFKCRYCVKVFQSAEGLGKHFARHKSLDVLHECRFCKKSYSTRNLLQDHISYVHVIHEDENSCEEETMFAFDSPSKGDKTGSGDASSKKYPLCPHCDLAFKNSEILHHHIDICVKNSDAKISSFVCDVCKECFLSDTKKREHIKKEHKRDTGFRCRKCSKVYRTWSRLKFHTKQQHLKKSCPDCSLIFTKEHVLRKHQEEIHGKPQGQPGDRVYTCSLCNTMLHTLTDLMNHRKEVHPELSGMRTADQSSNATMLSYIDNTNADVDSSYDVTTKTASLASAVIIKRSPSSDELELALFKCNLCGSNFEDEKRLKNHKGLIHGEKPFKCTECNKSFLYSSQVVWHMRSHRKRDKSTKVSSKLWKSKNNKFVSKVVPKKQSFVCQFCGHKFSQEKLLKNHKGSVHKIKLFSCEICGMKYGHSTELIWHVRTCRQKFQRNNPGKPLPTKNDKLSENNILSDVENDSLVCQLCGSEFSVFEDYQHHMRCHSGEEMVSYSDAMDQSKRKADNSADGVYSKKMKNNQQKEKKTPSSSHSNLSDSNSFLSQDVVENHKSGEALLDMEPEFDHSVGEYVCPVCQRTTKSLTGMKTHYGRVHGVWSKETTHKENSETKEVDDATWPCRNCDRQFASLASLRHHSSVIHGFTVNEEDVQVIRNNERNVSVANQGEKLGEKKKVTYACPHCVVIFTYSKSLRAHALKKHGAVLTDADINKCRTADGDKSVKATDPNADSIRFKCSKCKNKLFRSTKALRAHSRKRHNQLLTKKELGKSKVRVRPDGQFIHDSSSQVYPCGQCSRVFGNYRAQFTHYRQAHRNAIVPLPPPKKPSRNEITNYQPLYSRESNEGFEVRNDNENIEVSSKNVRKVESLDCPKCGNTFHQNRALYAHLYASHGITKESYTLYWPNGMPVITKKSSICPTCDKQCIDSRAMRIHMFKAHGVLYKDLHKGVERGGDDTETYDKDDLLNEGNGLDDALVYNDNELRFVEAEEGPPICFICGRSFKSRRALMTHEYKYHGIRWVGNKRIFPQKVRNVPNLKSVAPRNVEKLSHKLNNNHSHESELAEKNSSKDKTIDDNGSLNTSNLEVDSNSSHNSESTVEKVYNFACPRPLCSSRFHNRRALTTHLCRIHKYNKNDIHDLFGEPAENNPQNNGDNFSGLESLDNGEVYVLENDNTIIMNDKIITFEKDSAIGGFDNNDDIDTYANNGHIENGEDIVSSVEFEHEMEVSMFSDRYVNGESEGAYIDIL